MTRLPVFKEFGTSAVLLSWEKKIDALVNNQVIISEKYIKQRFEEVVLETVPAYNELAIYLKKKITPALFITILKENLKDVSFNNKSVQKKIITIPTCYNTKFGLDLERVAKTNKLSKKEVVNIHSAIQYQIYFLGFLPGFPYLGGLDTRICTPRLSNPRKHVERGSVAIGGNQTGVYPCNSPGGWNILGKTPIPIFDIASNPQLVLNAGDYIKFKPISIKEFHHIELEVKSRKYTIEKEVWYND